MRNKKLDVIVCPHCGREYLPAEIFVPSAFFGKPTYIDRDYRGKIIDYCGTTLDNIERYTCDGCNKEFKVYGNIKFNSVIDKTTFNEEYVSQLKKNNLLFPEE